MTEERHTVPEAGGSLALVLHLPADRGPAPCVVACHGLLASKDSDKYLLLGAEFPRAGLALARFDFRGCGESTGVEAETTVGTRVDNARAVLKWLGAHPRLSGRFGLLGSSLGGFAALHVAAERGDGLPVVTWNAPATFEGMAGPPATTAPGFGPAFFAELSTGRYAAAPTGVSRHLVIQGEADDVVPVAHGRALHARAAEPRALVIIPGADHRLTDMAHRREALARSLEWCLRFLP
ncbi:MAG: alpha/beta fold hydrolase [Candidatus Rokubacteria bacterium]|nr:alpha/beta fold hydrolase [Candidatus Rokubacteria bacterium]